MKKQVKHKRKTPDWIFFLIISIICNYFILTVDIIKEHLISIPILPNDFIFVIMTIVSFFVIKWIYIAYKWLFYKLLKNNKVKENILKTPYLIFGGITSTVIIIFLIMLNYYLFKIDRLSIFNPVRDTIYLKAEAILIPFIPIINYLVLATIICIILFQLIKLIIAHVPIFRAFLSVILSMALFLFLLDWLVYILNGLIIVPLLLLKIIGII